MENENERNYISYMFLSMKLFKKFELKANLKIVPDCQLNNFFIFLKCIMQKEIHKNKPNDFLLYSILRFASFIESDKNINLIKQMNKLEWIDKPNFWKTIMIFMSKNIYQHLNKKRSIEDSAFKQNSSNLFKNFGNFFKKKNSPLKKSSSKSSDIKSFEEISSLLFRIGVKFESIIEILIYLASFANIQFSMIKNILIKNKEVLYKQLEMTHQSDLSPMIIDKYHKNKSFLAMIRLEKGLSAFSGESKARSMSDSQILKEVNQTKSKSFLELKYDKIFKVVKLAMVYLTAKYDLQGSLMVAGSGQEMEGCFDSGVVERKMLCELRCDPKKKAMDKRRDSCSMRIRLQSVRDNDQSEIDELLDNAKKISQGSLSPSPTEKICNMNIVHEEGNKKNARLLKSDLSDILNILLMSRSMYKYKKKILKKILYIVWPLENYQRKLIYKSLIIQGLKKEKLIDYEESSYVFRRINQETHNEYINQHKESIKPIANNPIKKDFGETFTNLPDHKSSNLILNTPKKPSSLKSTTSLITPSNSTQDPNTDSEEEAKRAPIIRKTSLPLPQNPPNTLHRTNSNKYLPIRPKIYKKIISEKDNIISLDVKRTHVERAEFDHVALEQILRNISHVSMGNFAYYQGLNYIVAFFLDLMREPIDTYNVTVSLLETHFRKYVNSNMENLKVLFYVLKRLIKIYLPELHEHIDHTESLETNVIFANWILTVFTTLKQYGSQVALLDQITDIFISKGWTGFFRCILVILSHIQKDLVALQAEHLIMFMTDFPKRSFSLLGQKFNENESDSTPPNCDFNFKEECIKFQNIGNLLVHEMSMEYHHLQESYETKWLSLFKKVERLCQ